MHIAVIGWWGSAWLVLFVSADYLCLLGVMVIFPINNGNIPFTYLFFL